LRRTLDFRLLKALTRSIKSAPGSCRPCVEW